MRVVCAYMYVICAQVSYAICSGKSARSGRGDSSDGGSKVVCEKTRVERPERQRERERATRVTYNFRLSLNLAFFKAKNFIAATPGPAHTQQSKGAAWDTMSNILSIQKARSP